MSPLLLGGVELCDLVVWNQPWLLCQGLRANAPSTRTWLVVWARIDQHRRLELPHIRGAQRGLVVGINRQFTETFGYTPSEVV
jgi:hypothetical protein